MTATPQSLRPALLSGSGIIATNSSTATPSQMRLCEVRVRAKDLWQKSLLASWTDLSASNIIGYVKYASANDGYRLTFDVRFLSWSFGNILYIGSQNSKRQL